MKRRRRTYSDEEKHTICREYLAAKDKQAPGARDGRLTTVLRRHDCAGQNVLRWVAQGYGVQPPEAGSNGHAAPKTQDAVLALVIAACEAGVINDEQADRMLGMAVRKGLCL